MTEQQARFIQVFVVLIFVLLLSASTFVVGACLKADAFFSHPVQTAVAGLHS